VKVARYAKLVTCAVPLVLLTSCVTRTTKVTIQYAPGNSSPLAEFPSRTVAMQIVDERPIEDRSVVSRFTAGLGSKPDNIYVPQEPVPEIVGKAIRQEFERSGHRVIDRPSSEGDVGVTVFLKRFWVLPSVGTYSELAEVQGEMLATKPTDRDPVRVPIQGYFKSTYPKTGFVVWEPERDLSGALGDFVRNLTLEPTLIDAMK
jgi:hypothetical protein